MDKPTFDPGLTQQYTSSVERMIRKDGSFNVRRKGLGWRDVHPYLFMINSSWPVFLLLILSAYMLMNLAFAGIYCAIGAQHLRGAEAATGVGRFLDAFFFSSYTITTVGYGNITPQGVAANSVAAVEALLGLMTFALATGLLFGRFSRPAARIGFSERMIVAAYQGGRSLQFRVANRRTNNLMDAQAQILLMTVEPSDGRPVRRYQALTLERPSVLFLPLTWTIVHPIDEASPLAGKTADDLAGLQAEFIVLLRGFDDTFHQTVHSRYSYTHRELVWGARFAPAFTVDEDGVLLLEMDRLSELIASPLT